VIDDPFGNGHLREISVTRSAVDTRADMRRVIEPYVRFLDESVYPLPRQFFAALRKFAQGLNSRIRFNADAFMTRHAETDARKTRARSALHSRMTFIAFDSDFIGLMNSMREVYRLVRLGLDAQKMFGGITEAGVSCCKCRRTPTLGRIRICSPAGVAGYVGLPSTTECQNNGYQQPRRSNERVPAVMVRFHASHSSARFLILVSPFSLFIFSFWRKG
jgi:hypothetical protein